MFTKPLADICFRNNFRIFHPQSNCIMSSLKYLLLFVNLSWFIMFSGQTAKHIIPQQTTQSQEVTIHDIQFTENPNGESPYLLTSVTVTGIVTASAQVYDLGFVFMQDEGGGPWSGIWLWGPTIGNFYRGEEITVFGQVQEWNGMTLINTASITLTGNLKDITVTDVDPADSSSYVGNGWEKWESVLVQYKSPGQSKLYISHPKPDGNNDYGDYVVSPVSRSAVKKLGRILAGRVTSTVFSSLYVSIVSDSAWYDNSGQMQVDPIEATTSMEMDGVIGIMAYGFGDYRLLPRNNDDFININVTLDTTDLPGSPLSVEEFKAEQVSIYPNPANNQVQVVSASDQISGIRVFDLTGRQVMQHKLQSKSVSLNVSALSPGNYILQITTGITVHSSPVTIQR